ncbi:hypothetical protein [Natronomonas gomsonensis]|jgi:hypothetical protein|nr:hypothetical protein [Natronomonas gomsonensis]
MAVDVFGPFLIPAGLFFLGVVFYGVVVLLGRLRDEDDYRTDE